MQCFYTANPGILKLILPKPRSLFLVRRKFKMPQLSSTMVMALRLRIVLYTWVHCFHLTAVFLIRPARYVKPENSLPVDKQLQLFDSMMPPILLYGSESTGFEGNNVLEILFLQFYKYIPKANIHLMLYYTVNYVVSQWI